MSKILHIVRGIFSQVVQSLKEVFEIIEHAFSQTLQMFSDVLATITNCGVAIFSMITNLFGFLCSKLESALPNIIGGFFGGFFGAFFAFLFGLLTFVITKILERKNKGFNALVRLEAHFNEICNINMSNIELIKIKTPLLDQAIEVSKKTKGVAPIAFPREVSTLPLDKESLNGYGLCNIDLVNKISTFEAKLHKLNSDITAANKFFIDITALARANELPSEQYITEITRYKNNLSDLRKYSKELIYKEALEIKGSIRFLIKKKPLLSQIITVFIDDGIKLEKFKNEIDDEIKQVKQEIEIDSSKYKKQLEDIFGTR